MARQLTLDDARQSLTAHLADRGAQIHAKYGPQIGWRELHQLLEDRECARYPVEIAFDDGPLRDGEFAHPVPKGDTPADGYRMCVHPFFATEPGVVPALVLYQLVLVNYGDFATPDDAEIFGAAVLGIDREAYYAQLCELADLVSAGVATAPPVEPAGSTCGCGCQQGCS